MRVVVQRVTYASVSVEGEEVGACGPGFVAFVGVAEGDTEEEAQRIAAKVAEMRVFNDAEGRFDLSLVDVGGEALVISQFTLIADVRRGRRPSFNGAAGSEAAAPVVEAFARHLEGLGIRVGRGRFGAHMDIEVHNDGPVTIVIDSAALDRPRRQKE